MSKSNELAKYLKRLDSAFELDKIIQENLGLKEIEQYYFQSNLGYLLLHSPHGAVHMALSSSGKYNAKDYLKQVEFVSEEIKRLNITEILELGSGKGFNLYHLANSLPECNFIGLDLSTLHVKQSRNKLKAIHNATIIRADFHHIPAKEKTFDYVFEFESMCHALNIEQALHSVHNALKPGGYFTVFDGFRIVPMNQLNDDEKKARVLVEKPLGVQEGTLVEKFLSIAEGLGFEVIRSDDLSDKILPNLRHIQSIQNMLFPNAFPLRIAYSILPRYLIRNVIAGMLMPYMVEQGIQGYFQITLQRR